MQLARLPPHLQLSIVPLKRLLELVIDAMQVQYVLVDIFQDLAHHLYNYMECLQKYGERFQNGDLLKPSEAMLAGNAFNTFFTQPLRFFYDGFRLDALSIHSATFCYGLHNTICS